MPMMARQLGSIHAAIIKDIELLFNDCKIIRYLTLKNIGCFLIKSLKSKIQMRYIHESMKQAEL